MILNRSLALSSALGLLFAAAPFPGAGAQDRTGGPPMERQESIPLPEHPRPDFMRVAWVNLNGVWDFAFDPDDAGLKERWFEGREWPAEIVVPYVHQSRLSGIHDENHHRRVWYHRTFRIPDRLAGKRIRLHVGAADFRATVWINGREAGSYEGGYTPCWFDITEHLNASIEAENHVTIRVFDDELDPAQPRGKQHPSGGRNRWHYTHLTGIWQTVWLDAVPERCIERFQVVTAIDPSRAAFTVFVSPDETESEIEVRVKDPESGRPIAAASTLVKGGKASLHIDCPEAACWRPEDPRLYDVRLELKRNGQAADAVDTYIGFRTTEARKGRIYLNGEPLWLNGALDQGYYPSGLYTPPTDQALVEDILRAKRYGLNMIRKHQMVPSPRFLYHCDRLGLLVWGEMANAGEGHFSSRAADICLREWKRVIDRDFNHPCITAWVYSNENWMHGENGPEVVEHYRTAYEKMKAWDPTRPVIDTSGYYHVRSDILDVHDHDQRLSDAYAWARGELEKPGSSVVFLIDNIPYEGQPIVVSEWTCDDFTGEEAASWLPGYLEKLGGFAGHPLCAGHCYIQLYDVENERNGYLTYDRRMKVDPKVIRLAHDQAGKRDLDFDWKGFIQAQGLELEALLPTSEENPQAWRYTLEEPRGDWQAPEYEDADWLEGPGPFGTAGTPGVRPNTVWASKDIWLRRAFRLDRTDFDIVQLRLYHDEDAEVCLNGVLAAELKGWTTRYRNLAIPAKARAALRKGENVIAVHCRQTGGGQGIDAGLRGMGAGRLSIDTPDSRLKVSMRDDAYRLELLAGDEVLLASPKSGLWSIATGWKDDWPAGWVHAHPEEVTRTGPWLIAGGRMKIEGGEWEFRDAYRPMGDVIQCIRRFTWRGDGPARQCTLSVRWQAPAEGAKPLLPGICYYGNPSGVKTGYGQVAACASKPGEEALFEEHRYPVPFASLEWNANEGFRGAALHTLPCPVPFGNIPDQWWSLGVEGKEGTSELLLLTGPCAANGQRSVVKAQQRAFMKYPDTWLDVPPGGVIEKTFYLQAYPVGRKGSGFREPLRAAIEIHQPFSLEGLPSFDRILRDKYRFARTRWHEGPHSAGFRKYPDGDTYVMGWCGRAAAPGYTLLVLHDRLEDPNALDMAQRSLDHLTEAPFNEEGFLLWYDPGKNEWSRQDVLSQGQAMENFARAIATGRDMDTVDTGKWEAFLEKACDLHAARILSRDWQPRSTSEGFLISPLCKAHALFGKEAYRKAAIRGADHYAGRHLDMTEPYWGGTLDARCEDKEGAWAAFQAFLAVHEMTGKRKYLDYAAHAMDVALTYTVFWDIDMPPGRMRDHGFKSRGWTVVSAQNQHLDVFGVIYAPEIYRMGMLLDRDDLKKIALLMFRSCGQLIDPEGSQGEQIQHTNFGQSGDLGDVYRMRGGYSEHWTVFWITAHFLTAAAKFEEMGIPMDDG